MKSEEYEDAKLKVNETDRELEDKHGLVDDILKQKFKDQDEIEGLPLSTTNSIEREDTISKVNQIDYKFENKYSLMNNTIKQEFKVQSEEEGLPLSKTNSNSYEDEILEYNEMDCKPENKYVLTNIMIKEECKDPDEEDLPLSTANSIENRDTISEINQIDYKFENKYSLMNSTIKQEFRNQPEEEGLLLSTTNSITREDVTPGNSGIDCKPEIKCVWVNDAVKEEFQDHYEEDSLLSTTNSNTCDNAILKVNEMDYKSKNEYESINNTINQELVDRSKIEGCNNWFKTLVKELQNGKPVFQEKKFKSVKLTMDSDHAQAHREPEYDHQQPKSRPSVRKKKDSATLQREYRQRLTSAETKKRKVAAAAYMREYRARKKQEIDASLAILQQAKRVWLDGGDASDQQLTDPIAGTSAKATTNTESTEYNEKLKHKRAIAARNSRDYRIRQSNNRSKAAAAATTQSTTNNEHSQD